MAGSSTTDPLAFWARRLARRVAPTEVDVAADLAIEYATGDGPDVPVPPPRTDRAPAPLLPHLWHALDEAYLVLRALLSSPVVDSVSAIAGPVLARRRAGRSGMLTASPAARWTGVAVDRLRDGLASAGLSPTEAERIADDVVEEMLSDPASAADFLDRLRARS